MYERITIKLQLRVGDEEASDDEGRSNIELALREEISALKEVRFCVWVCVAFSDNRGGRNLLEKMRQSTSCSRNWPNRSKRTRTNELFDLNFERNKE